MRIASGNVGSATRMSASAGVVHFLLLELLIKLLRELRDEKGSIPRYILLWCKIEDLW